ncbi:hypothetical protein BDP55DRAFT_672551 [Colletotrichum godetiae]|uniref:Uncharacterized protein n=1 Tax=Colletotrichum godetiae TaxID=1209918 RepID=A0AAJ0EUS8_9PEZI|nr:uncharacterized protein BDP55DRAFT_672551 [Colletotrichum godetiae]KAK1672504.1 hypothetical protein BDP55DRAFT_672551 [Colletotrichum godetiae]
MGRYLAGCPSVTSASAPPPRLIPSRMQYFGPCLSGLSLPARVLPLLPGLSIHG